MFTFFFISSKHCNRGNHNTSVQSNCHFHCSSVSRIIGNRPELNYRFEKEQIFGTCKKFLPRQRKEGRKTEDVISISEPTQTISERTRFPIEVWVNIIKFLPCVIDLRNLVSTCKSLHRLRRTENFKNNLCRLPGWYCIPFNDDSDYSTSSPKGYTINFSAVNKIELDITLSKTSPILKKLKGKPLGILIVNSCSNIARYLNGLYGIAYV